MLCCSYDWALEKYWFAFPRTKASDTIGKVEFNKKNWTVCQIDGVNKRMCRVLTVNVLLLNKLEFFWMNRHNRNYLWSCCRTFLLKSTREFANRAGHSRQMLGESAQSKTYSKMSKYAVKRNKTYVHHPRVLLKVTCLIRGPGNSSY